MATFSKRDLDEFEAFVNSLSNEFDVSCPICGCNTFVLNEEEVLVCKQCHSI